MYRELAAPARRKKTGVNTLLEQLEASLDLNRDHGTEISFTFEKLAVRGSSSNILDEDISVVCTYNTAAIARTPCRSSA